MASGYIAPRAIEIHIYKDCETRFDLPRDRPIYGIQFAKNTPKLDYSVEFTDNRLGDKKAGWYSIEDIDYVRLTIDARSTHRCVLFIKNINMEEPVSTMKFYIYQLIEY